MRLRTVSISGFRSIDRMEGLSIGSPTLLAGHNDAGKSAIIDAIRFLLGAYKITTHDPTYLAVAEGEEPELDVRLEEVPRVAQTIVEGRFELREHEGEHGHDEVWLRRVSDGGASATLEVLRMAPTDKRLRDYGDLTIPKLQDRLRTLELSATGSKSDLLARLDAAAALAEQTEVWVRASNALEKALPAVQRFDAADATDAEEAIRSTLQTAYRTHLESEEFKGNVRSIEEGIETKLQVDAAEIRTHIMKQVADIGNVDIRPTVNFTSATGLKSTEIHVTNAAGEAINLRQSGAGRARRVALAVWEYNSLLLGETGDDIVLLYDEPDTHLDYSHQRDLMRLIHEQTKLENVAVVIATHSMNLIDGTDIRDVVHVKHEAHRTVVDRLVDDTDVGGHLGAIAASVGLRNTVLLHERLFVGVEGESEARALPVLFKLATGRQLESCGIALWPCENNEGALKFASFLVKHGRQVVFLVDEDSRRTAKHIFADAKLSQHGLDPSVHCYYVGDPNEVEEIFSDEQWTIAANEIWPRDGDDQPYATWNEGDFAAQRINGKFSAGVLDMVQRGSTLAPSGKPAMLRGMALTLKSPSDVPGQLVDRFEALISKAT